MSVARLPGDAPVERASHFRIEMRAELRATLYEILDAAILVLRGTFGNIELYDPVRGVLEIVAQRGFREEFMKALGTAPINSGLAGARAIRTRKRIMIPDVDDDPEYEPYRTLAANAGYRAIQATPMLSRDGEVLGALVTHLPEVRDFSAHELQVLDLYSRQAADAVVRARVERDLATARSKARNRTAGGRDGYVRLEYAHRPGLWGS